MVINYEKRQIIYDFVIKALPYLEIYVGGNVFILIHSGLRYFHPLK